MAITKIVQNSETGGTSNTNTPILKVLRKELLFPSEARHMTHCAKVGSANASTHSAAIARKSNARMDV